MAKKRRHIYSGVETCRDLPTGLLKRKVDEDDKEIEDWRLEIEELTEEVKLKDCDLMKLTQLFLSFFYCIGHFPVTEVTVDLGWRFFFSFLEHHL